MKRGGIDAALFDWSGTLVDDLDVVWRTNDATLMSFGVAHQDVDAFRKGFILPWQAFYGLFGLGTPEKLEEVDSRFWRIYRTLSQEIKPFPDALSILTQLKDSGLKTAVVTQTKKGPLMEQVRRFGWADLIDVAVAAEDVDELKPSPKPVLEALSKLGVSSGRAVFTGDMTEDALAGSRAGVKVISIVQRGGYHTEEMVKLGNPFAVAHSLPEVARLILSL